MFMDYILESETGYSYGVSQETMDEIDNLEVANFAESTESPFDLVSRSVYEFVQDNANMFKAIAVSEANYIKENGTEPIWEAEDHQNVFEKFISFVKGLISKITGAFAKLIQSIDKKIQQVYTSYSDKLNEKIRSKVTQEMYAKLKDKHFKMRQYNPEYGAALINKTTLGTLRQVSQFKAIEDALHNSKTEGMDTKELKGDVKGIISAVNARIFADLSGVDYSSSSSIRSALHNKMVSEVKSLDFSTAKGEIDFFVSDFKGKSLKAKLKDKYNLIKKKLGETIDDAKKNKKKADSKSVSKVTGVYVNILNKYTQSATLIYNETCKAYTAKWFQSLRLYLALTTSVSSAARANAKEKKKAEKEAKKANNESFGFSFDN